MLLLFGSAAPNGYTSENFRGCAFKEAEAFEIWEPLAEKHEIHELSCGGRSTESDTQKHAEFVYFI